LKTRALAALLPAAALIVAALASSPAAQADSDPVPELHRGLCASQHEWVDAPMHLLGTKTTPVFAAGDHQLTVTSTSYGLGDTGLRCDLVLLTSPDLDVKTRFSMISEEEVTADVDFGHGASDRLLGIPGSGWRYGNPQYRYNFDATPRFFYTQALEKRPVPAGTFVMGVSVYEKGWEGQGWEETGPHADDYFVLRHNAASWSLDVDAEKYVAVTVPATAEAKAAAKFKYEAAVKSADAALHKAKKAANNKRAAALKKAAELPKAAKAKAVKAATAAWKRQVDKAKRTAASAMAAAKKVYRDAIAPSKANKWTKVAHATKAGTAPPAIVHDFTPLAVV
jgi:hypothetical protein